MRFLITLDLSFKARNFAIILTKKPTHSAGPTLLYVHPDVEIYIEEINVS